MTTVRREFRLPDLGEGLTESDIVAWRIAEGDTVELNQIIAEVETAKALVELPSPYSGVVAELHVHEGETVNVGDPLVTFEVPDDAAPDDTRPPDDTETPDDAEGAADPSAEKPPPNLVGYGATAEHSGRPVRRRRPLRDAPTPPASLPIAPAPPATVRATAPSDNVERRRERRPSTPPVRRLARRLGVDLESVEGTGENGRVTRADLEAAASPGSLASPTSVTSRAADRPPAADTRVPIRGVRKHTAAAMVASAFTAPHVTVFLTVDVTPTIDLLARLREHPFAQGTRVTLLAIVAHAVCEALTRHPDLNSSWDEGAQEIVLHGRVNLGIAAATGRGLVVPHIPDAGSLALLELAGRLTELTELARSGRTPAERLRGGTFTITNVGVFGVDAGTPILNPGEAGILAVGAVVRRPWEYRGEIALREILTLSLSFDHRLVDGEQGSRFLADVGVLLAEPGLALLTAAPAGGTR